MLKKILILSDGIPGHFNQSKGIARLLAERFECSVTTEEISYRINFIRSIIIFLARILCKIGSPMSFKMTTLLFDNIIMKDFDLIIAAGGNTAPLTAALKNLSNKPAIQLGSPRGLHSSLFDALITVEKYFESPTNIVVDITPNLYSPMICTEASRAENFKRHILFLIGGNGIGYFYSLEEWQVLISQIHTLYDSTKLPITIVTSRRTHPKVEEKFRHELASIDLEYSVWFHNGDSNFNLAALLGSAAKIFVTEDSAMMISESISSGKNVSTLFPKEIKSPNRYKKHIKKYEDLQYISRQSISNFAIQEDRETQERVDVHQVRLLELLMQKVNW